MAPSKSDQLLQLVMGKLDDIKSGVLSLNREVKDLGTSLGALSVRTERIETEQKAQNSSNSEWLRRLEDDMKALETDLKQYKADQAAKEEARAEERGSNKTSWAIIAAVGTAVLVSVASLLMHFTARVPVEEVPAAHVLAK